MEAPQIRPDIDESLVIDELLDFSPLCEYGPARMEIDGIAESCEEVATWIAYSAPICDCRKSAYRFFCDPCLQYRSALPPGRALFCMICGASAHMSDHPILWAEPIKVVD